MTVTFVLISFAAYSVAIKCVHADTRICGYPGIFTNNDLGFMTNNDLGLMTNNGRMRVHVDSRRYMIVVAFSVTHL